MPTATSLFGQDAPQDAGLVVDHDAAAAAAPCRAAPTDPVWAPAAEPHPCGRWRRTASGLVESAPM